MKLEPSDKLPEKHEGPDAFTRFRDAVKEVLAAPKPSAVRVKAKKRVVKSV
jgi:uncharacterized protein (DUF1786 family)